MDSKLIVKILIGVLMLVVGYSVFSNNSAYKEIRRITDEMSKTADSLNNINQKYLELQTEYEIVELQLDSANTSLVGLRSSVDSILTGSIYSVSQVRGRLSNALNKYKPVKTLNTSNNGSLLFPTE